jgi:hypothetical protein
LLVAAMAAIVAPVNTTGNLIGLIAKPEGWR